MLLGSLDLFSVLKKASDVFRLRESGKRVMETGRRSFSPGKDETGRAQMMSGFSVSLFTLLPKHFQTTSSASQLCVCVCAVLM